MPRMEVLLNMAQEAGFTHACPLRIDTVELKQEVRQMCAENTCGRYGRNWSCPPACGELEDLRAQVAAFGCGLLVQTVGDVEDSFDFEAMMEIEQRHKENMERLQAQLLPLGVPVLCLGAGSCTLCKICTYPDAPCRFPERRMASMEAYGMLVNEICRANGMAYYYGADKLAYTGCVLLEADATNG